MRMVMCECICANKKFRIFVESYYKILAIVSERFVPSVVTKADDYIYLYRGNLVLLLHRLFQTLITWRTDVAASQKICQDITVYENLRFNFVCKLKVC